MEKFDEVQFARKNYRFTIYASLALALFAFIFTLVTLNFKFALLVSGFVLFFGFVLCHPRVVEEIDKASVPPSEQFKKRMQEENHRRTSASYQHLPGNSGHGSYINNYYPFKTY